MRMVLSFSGFHCRRGFDSYHVILEETHEASNGEVHSWEACFHMLLVGGYLN